MFSSPVPPATPAAATQLIAERLEALMMWSRRQARPLGLSATVFTTLDTLTFTGPMRISDLALRERVSQPAMTALVNRLEADGLADRQADPTDGRAALVSVTDAGRAKVAQFRAERTAAMTARLARLTPGERAALAAAVPALARLADWMDLTDSPTTRESSPE